MTYTQEQYFRDLERKQDAKFHPLYNRHMTSTEFQQKLLEESRKNYGQSNK